jgi:hypothetical protein
MDVVKLLPKRDPVRPKSYWFCLYALALVQLKLHDAFSMEKLFDLANAVGLLKYFVAGFVSLIVVGVIPVKLRDILVFWRIKYPLPGCRAFSVWMNRDPRIDPKKVLDLIGRAVPPTPEEENRKWYGLYKPIKMKPMVLKIHRKYLAGRDLTAQAWVLTVVLLGILFWEGVGTKSLGLFTFWSAILILVVSFSAQNHGERFVCTVLAEAAT